MKRAIYEKYGMGAFAIMIAAIILLAGIIPTAMSISNRKTSGEYELKTAKIVEIKENQNNSSHEVKVSFTVDDKLREMPLNTYNEGMKVGDEIEVWYAKSDWRKVTLVGSEETKLALFSPICAILFVVGIIGVYRKKKKDA